MEQLLLLLAQEGGELPLHWGSCLFQLCL